MIIQSFEWLKLSQTGHRQANKLVNIRLLKTAISNRSGEHISRVKSDEQTGRQKGDRNDWWQPKSNQSNRRRTKRIQLEFVHTEFDSTQNLTGAHSATHSASTSLCRAHIGHSISVNVSESLHREPQWSSWIGTHSVNWSHYRPDLRECTESESSISSDLGRCLKSTKPNLPNLSIAERICRARTQTKLCKEAAISNLINFRASL